MKATLTIEVKRNNGNIEIVKKEMNNYCEAIIQKLYDGTRCAGNGMIQKIYVCYTLFTGDKTNDTFIFEAGIKKSINSIKYSEKELKIMKLKKEMNTCKLNNDFQGIVFAENEIKKIKELENEGNYE